MKIYNRFLIVTMFGLMPALLGTPQAHAEGLTSYVGVLEQRLESQERLNIADASKAIVAWVCAEHSASDHGVKFEGCCKTVADLFANEKTRLNFLGMSEVAFEMTESKLKEKNKSSEEFWAEFGVAPNNAAICAHAILQYKQGSGFWDALTTEKSLESCFTQQMAPEFLAGAERLDS